MNPAKWLLCALLALPAITAPAAHRAPEGEEIDPRQIEVTLVPDSATIMPGEPAFVSLLVKNKSTHDLVLEQIVERRGTMKRITGITVTVPDETGRKFPEFDWDALQESLPGGVDHDEISRDLPASGTVALRVFLPWYFALKQNDSHTLAIAATLSVHEKIMYDEDGVRKIHKSEINIPVTATAKIKAIPMDRKKMDALVDALEKIVDDWKQAYESKSLIVDPNPRSMQEARKMDEAWQKLMVISDPRVIPWWRKQMQGEGRMEALQAVSKFNDDTALAMLKEALETPAIRPDIVPGNLYNLPVEQMPPEHAVAVFYLLRSPHPGALPLLIAHRHDRDPIVRLAAVQAAIKLPADEATPILQEMANDKDAEVSKTATVGILNITIKTPRENQNDHLEGK